MPKFCPHFHLSLQSGCDKTLKRMNRHYTTEEYAAGCEILRRYFDNPAITTDVIVGFPGETEEEFEETKAFLERIGFYEMHIFKYSRRAGTRADRMPEQVPEPVKIQRSHRLAEVDRKSRTAILHAAVRCGQPLSVLVETEEDGYLCGHTPNFMEVRFRAGEGEYAALHGRIVSVLPLCAEEDCITGAMQPAKDEDGAKG